MRGSAENGRGWEAHRDAVAERLRELLPYAQRTGIVLALENHQDATNEDFWWLYEWTAGRVACFWRHARHGQPAFGWDRTR